MNNNNPALKAAAIAFTLGLFSVTAQARPFMPEPGYPAPADHAVEYQPWTPDVILRAKHPAVSQEIFAKQPYVSDVPRLGTVEALQQAKYPWLYKGK